MARRDPPLKRLSEQQKHGELARLVGGTEAQIRDVYADARQSVRATLAQFAVAYGAERERLAEAREDDDEPVRVPLTWLHSSGWDLRLKHVMGQASRSASSASRRYVARGMGTAGALGRQNAHAQLRLALEPAIRKGMRWRPQG